MNAPATTTPAAPRGIRKGHLMALLRAAIIDNAAFDARLWSVADVECLEAAAAVIRREVAALSADSPAANPPVPVSPEVPRSERLDRELTRRADAALAKAVEAIVAGGLDDGRPGAVLRKLGVRPGG
jgi:hypothetical protein